MSTLRDVAARARVSTATASHAMNGTARVSPALKARVLEAARELHYRPNAAARTLKTSRSRAVGIIVPDISDPFFPDLVRGAEDTFSSSGYTLLIGNSDNNEQREETYLRAFLERQVEGLVVVASSDWAPDYVRRYADSGLPIIYADRGYLDVEGDVVMADNVGGSRRAVQHLIDQGFRAIGTIAGPRRLANARGRIEGYERALQAASLPIRPEWVREGSFKAESGYREMVSLLELPEPPDAVFVANALMTLGAFKALQQRKLRMPEDIGLVSFDEQFWFEAVHPSITAIGHRSYELGATAASLLLDRIAGTGQSSRVVRLLEGELLVRESTLRKHSANNSVLPAAPRRE